VHTQYHTLRDMSIAYTNMSMRTSYILMVTDRCACTVPYHYYTCPLPILTNMSMCTYTCRNRCVYTVYRQCTCVIVAWHRVHTSIDHHGPICAHRHVSIYRQCTCRIVAWHRVHTSIDHHGPVCAHRRVSIYRQCTGVIVAWHCVYTSAAY